MRIKVILSGWPLMPGRHSHDEFDPVGGTLGNADALVASSSPLGDLCPSQPP